MNRLITSVIIVVFSILQSSPSWGQYYRKENNYWAFSRYCGLDFNSGAPQPVLTAIRTDEGSATISDAQGNLLFYTNGDSIWNRNHQVMPNGGGLAPGKQAYSTTQAAVIVPVYDNPNQYYVFSLGASAYAGTVPPGNSALSYSVVDMTLDNGLGDVIPGRKEIPVDQFLSERMITIPGVDCRIWVVCQGRDSSFKAWAVTDAGIDPNPVVSFTGFTYPNYSTDWRHLAGVMKASPDGTKLVGVYGQASYYYPQNYNINTAPAVQLFDFDPNTGIVSNARTISLDSGIFYGAAFSPDNSKLYVRVRPRNAPTLDLWQYDLNAGNLITQSKLVINSNSGFGGSSFISDIQLGPDGKIYIPSAYNKIDRVNQPNVRGIGCQYEPEVITLPVNFNDGVLLGMSNIVNVFPIRDTLSFKHQVPYCFSDSQIIYAFPKSVRHQWQDGSTDSFYIVRDTGTYVLHSIQECIFRIDSFIVQQADTIYTSIDTNLCSGATLILSVAGPRDEYFWDNGSTTPSRNISQPGTYFVYSSFECQPFIDSFHIKPTVFESGIVQDTIVCDNPPLTLYLALPDTDWVWPDGTSGDSFQVWEEGNYAIELNRDGCIQTDHINVRFYPVVPALGPDTVLCKGSSIDLKVDVSTEAEIIWQDGSTNPRFTVTGPGTYSVEITHGPCKGTDTIDITQEICSCKVFIPTAFTPNNDGRNDYFLPLFETGCPVAEYQLRVFNRWGALVFTSTDPSIGWDGNFGGEPAEQGIYMYHARFKQGTRLSSEEYSGDLTLIR